MKDLFLKNKKWILVLAILIGIGLSVDILAKQAVTIGASQVMGVPVRIDYLDIGFLRPSINISGFKIYNPQGFPQGILLDLRQVRVDYDIFSLLKGKFHAPLVIVDLKEMVVVKNKEGKLNVDALKISQQKEQAPGIQENKSAPSAKMQMDVVKLNIDHIVSKDFSQDAQGQILVYDINLKDKVFKDVTSPQQLATLIMVQAMGPTAIKSAAVYGAATVLGVAFLPAGVAGILIGKDSATETWSASVDKVYRMAVDVIKRIGKLKNEDASRGIIKGSVYGADVQIAVKRNAEGRTEIEVTSRKAMLPKPEIAAGVLYQIKEKL